MDQKPKAILLAMGANIAILFEDEISEDPVSGELIWWQVSNAIQHYYTLIV
jgi:hypothetical protein